MWHRWSVTLVVVAAVAASALGRTRAATTNPVADVSSSILPATAPASQPAMPVEPSTPRDALKIFAAAMRDGDAERLKSVVLTTNLAEVRMLGAMAGLAESLARLNQSAVKAFGEDDSSRFTDDSNAHFAQTLARIEAAEVTIDGDRATVKYRGPGEPIFELRGLPSAHSGQELQWKVPMSELAPGAEAAALDQRLIELNVQRKIVDELADEIAGGKYKNAEAGKEAWREKIMQTLPSRPPGTAPAAPSTRTMGQ
jgi:hypothetical protein